MKSKQQNESYQNILISRKKPLTNTTMLFSLLGFILFLTGGLVVATAAIDGIFNQFSTTTLLYVIAGFISYKAGRHIMERSAS